MIFFPGSSQILYHFPGDVAVKNPPANVGDTRYAGLISGSGRYPGVGNSNPLQYPLQYSCLEEFHG